jgi:hypothetical protein
MAQGKPKAMDIVERAKEQLAEITGREPESVVGLERDENGGGWTVSLELLELHRVPETMDVLGCYVVHLDDGGEIVEYERQGRYERGRVSAEDR